MSGMWCAVAAGLTTVQDLGGGTRHTYAPPNRRPGGRQIERYTMSTKNYWFTEHGEWGSVEVEYVSFNSNHHDGIEQSFDLVSDWQLPDWARYLASRPHALEESGFSCGACEILSDEFRGVSR